MGQGVMGLNDGEWVMGVGMGVVMGVGDGVVMGVVMWGSRWGLFRDIVRLLSEGVVATVTRKDSERGVKWRR